jgi:glutathione synthase/RimK-type ligase-like ATP-grasp enzyme
MPASIGADRGQDGTIRRRVCGGGAKQAGVAGVLPFAAMRESRLALATCARLPDLAPDDRRLLPHLPALGIAATPAIWNDPEVRWRDFDAVLLRSCWDYHHQVDAFLAWLAMLEAQRVLVWNPPALIRRNVHKGYLRELEAAGHAIVPTAFLERGTRCDLADLRALRGWARDVVLKPAVSATAFRTLRVQAGEPAAQSALDALLADGDTLVQPYLPEVARHGEWSLVFLGGAYSHAILKQPAAGDFRVQEDFGGVSRGTLAAPDVVRQAAAILGSIPEPCLYARVDGLVVDGRLLVMELELTEPSLFLDCDPDAARRLAVAVAAALDARPTHRA